MTVCTRCGAIGGYHKGWCPEQPADPLPMTAPAEDPRGGEHVCSRWCAQHAATGARPAGDRESNARRLAWFTDAELAAELNRRALVGA